MVGGVMFYEVFGKVDCFGIPVEGELALVDAVSDPLEKHVDGAQVLLLDSSIDDACWGAVVTFYWSVWLGISYFFKGGADGNTGLGVFKYVYHLGLCCISDEIFHDAVFSVDGAVVGWLLWRWLDQIIGIGAEKKWSTAQLPAYEAEW